MNDIEKQRLREVFKADLKRQKDRTITDENGIVYKYDSQAGCFLGKSKSGKYWVHGINTLVKAYWVYCHNCKSPNFILIYEDGVTKKCWSCKTSQKMNI